MNYYNYLLQTYGEQTANTYLEILKKPLNESQWRKDKIDVLKLINELDNLEKKKLKTIAIKRFLW